MPGVVLYRGKSQLDGLPIICIATEGSKNVKTGPMVQTWILRSDISPLDSVASGEDASICGQCPHRKQSLGTCYVQVAWSPTAVWKAYHRGGYVYAPDDFERGRDTQMAGAYQSVRLGAYGDPAAVPQETWMNLLYKAKMWTGYTHQWREPQFQYLKQWCMASVDSLSEYGEATSMGWRTFRVANPSGPKWGRERVCPASDEAGKKLTCIQCGICSGTEGKGTSNVVINVHGTSKGKFNVR